VVRLEDTSLSDLADIAIKIFDKVTMNPGSFFLIGSASQLFRTGVAAYAHEWVSINNSLSKRFKTIHVCPLVPMIFENTAGGLARDIEMLAMWLHKVYGTGIKGMGEMWSCAASHASQYKVGSTVLQYEEIVKISLPTSLDTPGMDTFFFKFRSSSPARLCGMDRKVIYKLLHILLHNLKTNFLVLISSEVILPREPPTAEDAHAQRHLVCVGSSILKQTIPYLRALGYRVTVLARPGWLATQENIDALISELSKLSVPPGLHWFWTCSGTAATGSHSLTVLKPCHIKKGAGII
jgi:hypothetical protein